jgi:hypothetical protein
MLLESTRLFFLMALTGLLFSSCKKEDMNKQYEGTYHGIYRKTEYKPATSAYDVVVDSSATATVSGIDKGNITVTVKSVFFPSTTTFTGRFTSSYQFSSGQSAAHAIQTTTLMGRFWGDTLKLAKETRYNGILHYSLELVATRR